MIENADGVFRVTDIVEGVEVQVYDSSVDELLHCLPPRIDGSISRPSANWAGSTNWTYRDYDTSLGTLPSEASDIVGLCRVTYSGGFSHLPSGGWYVLGGSLLLIQKDFQTISGNWGDCISSIVAATIYKSGNQLRFKEQLRLKDHYMAGPNLNMSAYTVAYRLFPAVFS